MVQAGLSHHHLSSTAFRPGLVGRRSRFSMESPAPKLPISFCRPHSYGNSVSLSRVRARFGAEDVGGLPGRMSAQCAYGPGFSPQHHTKQAWWRVALEWLRQGDEEFHLTLGYIGRGESGAGREPDSLSCLDLVN